MQGFRALGLWGSLKFLLLRAYIEFNGLGWFRR